MRTSYVMSSFPRFFVSLFLFPSFLCFLVSSFPRFFVSWFPRFLVSSFLRFLVSSFLRFFVSSFLRFFVSSFLHFFVSSFPRAHWRAPRPRLEVQFPCVFFMVLEYIFLILLLFFLILLIFFLIPIPPVPSCLLHIRSSPHLTQLVRPVFQTRPNMGRQRFPGAVGYLRAIF